MYFISLVILSFLLLNTVQAQSFACSCSCCLGQGCLAASLPSVVAQQCTDASCLEACRARYYQCTAVSPNGLAVGRCLSATTTTTNSPMIGGPYLCQCNCCRTGSYSCAPSFIGNTNAFSCQIGACSIACSRQYPNVCVNNEFGQTQGVCVGTPSTTPTLPNGSLRCGCACTTSSGFQYYEMVTANGCSSCIIACRSIQLQCSNHQNTYCVN